MRNVDCICLRSLTRNTHRLWRWVLRSSFECVSIWTLSSFAVRNVCAFNSLVINYDCLYAEFITSVYICEHAFVLLNASNALVYIESKSIQTNKNWVKSKCIRLNKQIYQKFCTRPNTNLCSLASSSVIHLASVESGFLGLRLFAHINIKYVIDAEYICFCFFQSETFHWN